MRDALNKRLDQIRHHPVVEKLQQRYDQLPHRDRRVLQVLGAAAALTLIWVLIWLPVQDFRDSARQSANSAEAQLGWVQSQETRARRAAEAGESSNGQLRDGDILRTVTQSAQQSGMPLQRFEPSGDRAMRIWLDNVVFTELIQWLDYLGEEYGIDVDQASMDRLDEPGRVNVRMTLEH